MELMVRLFGPQAVLVGSRALTVTLPAEQATVSELRGALREQAPLLRPSLESSRIAVNSEFAADADCVRSGDEVALVGMVSGG